MLRQTENAFAELAASRDHVFGTHFGEELRTSAFGTEAGEVPFDPARHSVGDIDPFSLMELAIGEPHVQQVLPSSPLTVNVLVHHDSPDKNHPYIAEGKRHLERYIGISIAEAVPGITDEVRHFVIGYPETTERSRYIEGSDDPEVATKTIADICIEGVSFIISDFEGLPLDKLKADRLRRAVGIKANHFADVDLSPLIGQKTVLRVGGDTEINLRRRKEVESFNVALKNHDHTVKGRMQRAGMAVAQVIFRPEYRLGFDVSAADQSIAEAIRTVGHRL